MKPRIGHRGDGKGRVRVAIVGRPNVGKSTLFNRLLGRRRAITLDQPGITRDPILEPVEWDGFSCDLVDTGGLQGESDIALADRVHEHTLRAIAASDIVVVLFDAKAGLNPLDAETVELVSRSGRPVVFAANKGEGRAGEQAALEFCALGIDPPLVVSAEHGQGITELQIAIEQAAEGLPREEPASSEEAGQHDRDADRKDDAGEDVGEHPDEEPEAAEGAALPAICRVALVGRPNVGKSSLLNLLAGEELSLVDNRPGTTRDVVDTEIERGGRHYLLVDTAGMRRPSRVEEGVERISVRRSLEAIERADVVVLLVEPEEGVTDQDARIARRAWDEGRALVVLVSLMLLSVTVLGSTIFSALTNGIVVFMLYGVTLMAGVVEQVGTFLNNDTLIRIGIAASLVLPSDAVWRLASYTLQPAFNVPLTPLPFTATTPPTPREIKLESRSNSWSSSACRPWSGVRAGGSAERATST